MRVIVTTLVVGGLLLVNPAPAAPPDAPVSFIKADELKALLDRGTRADIIDVRAPDVFQEMHIRGARSIPLRSVEARAREITRTGLVVFY